jgi:hypothetical protein
VISGRWICGGRPGVRSTAVQIGLEGFIRMFRVRELSIPKLEFCSIGRMFSILFAIRSSTGLYLYFDAVRLIRGDDCAVRQAPAG